MSTRNKHLLGISLLLAMGTLAAFWPVTSCRFVNYDDPRYLDIPQVRGGLTASGIKWALTSTHAGNWHPLTWMSLMLDRTLYGDHPAGYHVTSLLFHIAATILLFLLLARITGSIWRSGFVAALFGIHPLHVESVAWVAERKDVLSAFLMMLVLWAYVLYTERPTLNRRLSTIALFALGLMAKPMLVTLPFMLLLLDYWPLGRFKPAKARKKNQPWVGRRLLLEKVPLFALSCISSIITIHAQHRTSASLEQIPVWLRLENGLLSYSDYLWKTFWPAKLSFFYPYSVQPASWMVMGAGVLLALVTALAVKKAKSHPYLAFGWLWYLVTLVPVIGLIQVGNQAMADRYTYIPLIGLFATVVWAAADLLPGKRVVLPALAGLVILSLGMMTWHQAGYWHDSLSLSRHAIAVTKDNYEAQCMLGVILSEQGKSEEAVSHFLEAIRIRPNSAVIHTGFANALANQGKFNAAMAEYREAIRLEPNYALAHYNLGMILAALENLDEAIVHLSKVAEINRSSAKQPELFVIGKPDLKAIEKLSKQSRISPGDPRIHYQLAIALAKCGRLDEAVASLSKARRLKPLLANADVVRCLFRIESHPEDYDSHLYLGFALTKLGYKEEGIAEYRQAIRLRPGQALARNNLAVALYFDGQYAEAWKEVHECRKLGVQPAAGFLKALSAKQPDPLSESH